MGFKNTSNLLNKKLIINLNNKLYNLLTDKGTFKISNIIFFDYNSAIDQFLEK